MLKAIKKKIVKKLGHKPDAEVHSTGLGAGPGGAGVEEGSRGEHLAVIPPAAEAGAGFHPVTPTEATASHPEAGAEAHHQVPPAAAAAAASPAAAATAQAAAPTAEKAGPLPAAEALDYTHDTPWEEVCDYGAGPLELGDHVHHELCSSGGEEGLEGCDAASEAAADSSCAIDGGGGGGDGGNRVVEGEHPEQVLVSDHWEDGGEGPSPQYSPRGEGDASPGGEEGGGGGSASSPCIVHGMDGGDPVGGEPPLSDPLATMVYLTEEEEVGGQGDAISVLSDGLTEDELAEELSELELALSALEGEALGSSPGGYTPGASPGLDKELAVRLGLSPEDGSDPSVYAKQMVKLYTNLGLKLMDSRKFDEALGMMRKAEALVENDAMWGGPATNATKRKRLQAITCNNIGCLFKRRNHPQLALQYLMKALGLEEEIGHVQNSSSTHLNICAAYSSLKKYKEALSHAERAILQLQRQLWAHSASFQEGLLQLSKVLTTAGDKKLLSCVNVLAIAYHNAGLEQERLGRLREAHVCFTRASTITLKCLGPRAAISASLQRALKAFVARHQPTRGRAGGAGTPRAGPQSSAQVKVRQTSPKRGSRAGGSRPPTAPRTTTSRSALAASSAKSTLPLDKGVRGFGKEARSSSASKLSDHMRR